ncbi:MAG: DUF937 domain-containing protein [Synechococcales cyanobacterium M58_A2018_015]|nr:DUF937 domain-containing protein [Synechococcales cyanobacterium M58_A2018_015]
MGLFFEVLSAINNPNQQASVDQLSSITNTVQQLAASRGIEPSTMQTVLSGLGSALRPAMQQQARGGGSLENLMGQLTGASGGLGALSSFLPPQMQQQLVQGIAQKTGISAGTLEGMLPTLIPVVMNLLKMGNSTSGGGIGSNPLLRTFLDSDNDQDVDLGDVFKFANRFLTPAR